MKECVSKGSYKSFILYTLEGGGIMLCKGKAIKRHDEYDGWMMTHLWKEG